MVPYLYFVYNTLLASEGVSDRARHAQRITCRYRHCHHPSRGDAGASGHGFFLVCEIGRGRGLGLDHGRGRDPVYGRGLYRDGVSRALACPFGRVHLSHVRVLARATNCGLCVDGGAFVARSPCWTYSTWNAFSCAPSSHPRCRRHHRAVERSLGRVCVVFP